MHKKTLVVRVRQGAVEGTNAAKQAITGCDAEDNKPNFNILLHHYEFKEKCGDVEGTMKF